MKMRISHSCFLCDLKFVCLFLLYTQQKYKKISIVMVAEGFQYNLFNKCQPKPSIMLHPVLTLEIGDPCSTISSSTAVWFGESPLSLLALSK